MRCATRFAPSPTGRLHLGHAFSALLAHDFARERGGAFLLRIEDIDAARSRSRHADAILEDLAWLGLEYDGEIIYQSERLEAYDEALAGLREQGLVYPCFCTRAEIAAEIAASASAPQQGAAAASPYPGTCRSLAATERARRLEAEPHAWRLDMERAIALAGSLRWIESGVERRGDPAAFGDVVLARKDAPASYHLAVVLDDAAAGVTDVIRGRDLLASTHVHRLLQSLLDLPAPAWHHHDLVLDAAGRRLAKRDAAATLAALRDAGADPAALAEGLRARDLPAGYSFGPG